MRFARLLPLIAALAIAACDSPAPESQPSEAREGGSPATSFPPVAPGPTPEEMAALEDTDCRVVAQAYADALSRRAFGFAAELWNDPVIDDDRLAALFDAYVTPRITIADVQEEGAAGTIMCIITGSLADGSDPRVQAQSGELVLSRVNDVPGATEEQMQWRLRSSSFLEPMERSRR